MKAVTEPDAVVLLSVVDKSLSLLADACKSLEKDNVSDSTNTVVLSCSQVYSMLYIIAL